MDCAALHHALMEAHEAHDLSALVGLYTVAANHAEQSRDIDAACFYLTHAFVFALETGAPEVGMLNQRLVDQGRAQPLPR